MNIWIDAQNINVRCIVITGQMEWMIVAGKPGRSNNRKVVFAANIRFTNTLSWFIAILAGDTGHW
jgi:hypothetical protein